MTNSLYWIHHPDHTDMFTQGYIGISNNVKMRWYKHKAFTQNAHLKNAINKYGWDALIKEIILIADEAYCLMVELQLRPTKDIGWNIIEGGGKPPKNTKGKGYKVPNMSLNAGMFKPGLIPWNKGKSWSEETKQKISASKKGQMPWIKGKTGFVAWNKGKKTPDDVKLKQRLAKLGKKLSMETRLKMSQAQLNRKLGEQHGQHA